MNLKLKSIHWQALGLTRPSASLARPPDAEPQPTFTRADDDVVITGESGAAGEDLVEQPSASAAVDTSRREVKMEVGTDAEVTAPPSDPHPQPVTPAFYYVCEGGKMCIRDASGRIVQRGLPPPPSIDDVAGDIAGLLPVHTVQLPTGLALTAPPPVTSAATPSTSLKKAMASGKPPAVKATTSREQQMTSPSRMSISSGNAPTTSTPAPAPAPPTATPLASTLAAASASFVASDDAACLRRQHVLPPSDPEPLLNYTLPADYEIDESYTTEAESQSKEGWKLV